MDPRLSFNEGNMNRSVIHILGASGSGTTTLARAICARFGHRHLDTDDFFWMPTNPPFTTKRELEPRVALLAEAINTAGQCVLSGSLCGWGDVFISQFRLVILIETPTEVRIKRLHEREFGRFRQRILEGGDMYGEHRAFIDWASNYDTGGLEIRSAKLHDEWLKQVSCPVLRLDGTLPMKRKLTLVEPYIGA